MNNFFLIFLAAFTTVNSEIVTPLPVTFYLGDLGEAVHQTDQYLYYNIKLCPSATQNFTQMQMTISLPNNPTWDTNTYGYIFAQISKCKDSFVGSCVIEQNYAWNGGDVVAVPTLIMDYKDEPEFYIRILSGNLPTQFSMEFEFLQNSNTSYYNWTTDEPFGGSTVSKQPETLKQYWRANVAYNVSNHQLAYFALAYCIEDASITGIDIAITTPPSAPDSLVTAFACPQSIPAESCKQSVATQSGWVNPNVASFNLLQCPDESSRSTKNGIYVVIEGFGGNPKMNNYFNFQATTRT